MRRAQSKLTRMPGDRLALALERLPAADWQYFEKLAAEFLAVDYPSLRTTASPHGDKGRDGQIYVPTEDPQVAVQYSVAADWNSKIRETIKRLAETMPSVTELIYATNQLIGPDADDLVREIRRQKGVYLDIRDRSWFLDRELSHPQREAASIEIAKRIVEPLLLERRLRENVAPAIDAAEARIGLLHIALEAKDEASSKNLTKTCFESIVLAALHDTSPDQRASRATIHDRVESFLPAGHELQVSQQVDSALQRLSGRHAPIKHYIKHDEFCLSFAERERVAQKIAEYLLFEVELEQKLTKALRTSAPDLSLPSDGWERVGHDLRVALETVLLRRGEAFVEAIKVGRTFQIDAQEVLRAVGNADRATSNLLTDEQVATVVYEVLERPSRGVRLYLHRLADSYTMFAFMKQTPDVQKALVKIFSNGELWLDTSVILPAIAETLVDDVEIRRYSAILRAAKDAGLRLFVTGGVIEEVERHLNKSLVFSRTSSTLWRSNSIPFVYSMYALSGRARASFSGWVETFRGNNHPEDDIAEYLAEAFGIELRDLVEYAEKASPELRGAVQEVWHEAHERRRSANNEDDSGLARHRLIAHDVENTVGVIELRKKSGATGMGYRVWWLTLDGIAFTLDDELKDRLGKDAPRSPAISPDFMSQYLRLGPLRTAIDRQLWTSLPILTDISRFDFLPKDLVDLADSVRLEHNGLDEHVVRRRVRDTVEKAKMRRGPEAFGGVRKMTEDLQRVIASQRDG